MIQHPNSGYIYKGNKITVLKKYLHSHVHCNIIHNSQDMQEPQCSLTDEWIKKMWYVCICMHTCIYIWILFSQNQEGNPPTYDNMDGPSGNCAKRRKTDRERQMLYDLTYVWNLKMSESQKQRVNWWLPGAGGWGKWGDIGNRTQTFSYEMKNFLESYHIMAIVNDTILLHLKVAMRVDLKSSHHNSRNKIIIMWDEGCFK